MKPIWIWLAALLASVVILLTKLSFTYDLALFLPPPKTSSQIVLVEQLGQSPGSALMLIGLENAQDDLLLDIRDHLSESPVFDQVRTDLDEINVESIPDAIWQNRFLLQDFDFSSASLTETLRSLQTEVSLFGNQDYLNLIAADPFQATIQILDEISIVQNTDEWRTDDGFRIILAQTATSAFDIEAQNTAMAVLADTLSELAPNSNYAVTGVGAFSSKLQKTISAEATFRSILASLGMAIVLLIAYRRLSVILLTALPLLTGGLVGLASLAIIYPEIHGITLAFGFTLLGVAIDYPLHLFSHARHQSLEKSRSDIAHPLITGLISTVMAYLTIALSGAEGLAQLGLFTAVGLTAAALTTLAVMPIVGKSVYSAKPAAQPRNIQLGYRAVLVFAIVVLGQFVYLKATPDVAVWNNDLSSLSPVPKSDLMRDHDFRSALGTPDLRYLLTIRDPDLQTVLESTETTDMLLQEAIALDSIDGWSSVSSLIPSANIQQLRRSNLPDETTLAENLHLALETLAFRADAFNPFLLDVENAKSLPTVTRSTYAGQDLESYINSHLYQSEGDWVSVMSLFQPAEIDLFGAWLEETNTPAELVDLKQASENLVEDYRTRVIQLLGLALVMVLGILVFRVSYRRAIWCIANVAGGITFTALSLLCVTGQLDLYHLIALLLVAGLGLDYSLFLSQENATVANRKDIIHATTACASSTIVVFAILGGSAIPALNSLGTAVALGSLSCFLLARFGSSVR